MRHRMVLCGALALAACGGGDDAGGDAAGGPDAPPAADAPGTPDAGGAGTGRLLVVGTFVVENPANGTTGTNLRVNCEVRGSRDGQPVEDAVVNVNPAPPAFQTLLVQDALDRSHYTGWYFNYADTARLSVRAGDDFIAEVTLRGPAVFAVEQPTAGANVPSTADLRVTWTPPPVDRVDVALGAFTMMLPTDPTSFDVPAGALAPLAGMDARVEVTRWRHDPLGPGAAPGSYVDFGVRSVQPIHVQ